MEPTPPQIPGYKVVRLLGEGGMGMVYEAIHEILSRRVAVKVLNTESARDLEIVERFHREAQVVNLIEHPSVVQVTEQGTLPGGHVYLVMEFLRGETLRARLRRCESLPLLSTLQFCWQVADALCAAHVHGIIHRDIKPENLMLVPDSVAPGGERVKILDFGIAKVTHAASSHTQSQAILGTPRYMSPEQCRGAREVDAQTDVYSLGVILFECLSGRTPFEGEPGELIGRHLFMPPPSLATLVSGCDPAVAALADSLLTKDKAKRPNMTGLRTELERLLAQLTGSSALSTWPQIERSRQAEPVRTPSDNPSTMGVSVGQSSRTKIDRRLVGLATLMMMIVAVVLLRSVLPSQSQLKNRKDAQSVALEEIGRSTPRPTISQSVKTVRWSIDTIPTDAAVLDLQGRELGRTPWSGTRTLSSGLTRLQLHRTGYLTEIIDLRGDQAEERRIQLTSIVSNGKANLKTASQRRAPSPSSEHPPNSVKPSRGDILNGVE